MKSNSSYPILAKEGWGIIGAAIFITLLVWWLIGGFISFIFFVLLVFVIQFFRDPPRAISQTPHSVLSGADGRICKVQKVENPYTGKEEILISTFMNVFNIHSNRSPIGGTVEAIYYKPGKFLNADLDKASMENERNAIIISVRKLLAANASVLSVSVPVSTSTFLSTLKFSFSWARRFAQRTPSLLS